MNSRIEHNETMSTRPIERIFQRMQATYGMEWERNLGSAPIADVKTVWLDMLSSFLQSHDSMKAIAWALDNLPERCPNAIAFRNLCRQAPAVVKPALPEPKADPERLKAELAKLAPLASEMKAQKRSTDGREWARLIMQRFNGGEKMNPTTLAMARSALNLEVEAA